MASCKTPKSNHFQITAEALPGAIFFSVDDLRTECDGFTSVQKQQPLDIELEWTELVDAHRRLSYLNDNLLIRF